MRAVALITIAGAFLFSGCVAMQPNPQFSSCANACTKKQDACMVNASTAEQIAACNATLDSCVAGCEKKFPRYIQP